MLKKDIIKWISLYFEFNLLKNEIWEEQAISEFVIIKKYKNIFKLKQILDKFFFYLFNLY